MDDPQQTRTALLRDPDFRWMMGGAIISALGDQFTIIALPWLVLVSTGDPFKMGLVIALMSVPRAIFILLGGALVDRYSPKSMLMISKYVNTVLLALLAGMVLTGHVSLGAISVLALAIGFASAFSIPAGTSMLPNVVAPAQLPMANGMMMGVRQVTMLAGPLLAGLLMALFGDGSGHAAGSAAGTAAGAGAAGVGIAFAVDSASFLLSAWTLSKVKLGHAPPKAAPQAVLRAVGAGLAMVWNDTALRTCMLYWGLCSFVVGGTMQVALPVLASTVLHGASALGLIMGVHGAGSLAGMALSGVLGKFRVRNFGTTVLLGDVLVGLLLMPLGLVAASWQAAALMLAIGVLGGFMQVAVFSWLQQRVPRAMLGRAMSIFMFIFMGVAPLSAALTGYLLQQLTLAQLFGGAGLFLMGTALLAWLLTPMSTVADGPPPPAQA
ncbi:MFS transporter [Massilia antarctica]|uniref:MFS transporter n=1 Tax=Massilia antarctica TaxID=2765360 RepID=UPI0006BB8598|nr:MFS transporter [Massilia sp. H27-R4]MCY0915584.1 MFS transporter [Massilia sp. H27-R4]CUI04063.1 transporter, putative [Janthinobacterium sp. CG23_2]CUU27849.1 transporter, putative [Janthinobacterium sp. CG23_2]